jgi:hypothetical protein
MTTVELATINECFFDSTSGALGLFPPCGKQRFTCGKKL